MDNHVRTHRKVDIYKPTRDASEGTNFANPLILDFQPPEKPQA